MTTFRKAATGAIRLAAFTQLGPIAGAVFLGDGSVVATHLTGDAWAKAGAGLLNEVAGGKVADFFGCAVEGFSPERNHDLEKSMHAAVGLALSRLRIADFSDWFDDWRDYLARTEPAALFTRGDDAEPIYDDDEFRSLWWSRMEPLLLRWRAAEHSDSTQLHLSLREQLPSPLRERLRAELAETIERAQDEVLRDPKMGRSWIAQQQNTSREMLRLLRTIEAKVSPSVSSDRVWSVPPPTRHFQERPELMAQIADSLSDELAAIAVVAVNVLDTSRRESDGDASEAGHFILLV